MIDGATLLMMPEGDRPEKADFAAGDDFATFEAAVRAAQEATGPDKTLVPWIRFGGAIMDPAQVTATDTHPKSAETLAGTDVGDRLDADLENTFPASDPPSRTEP